jgi:hypothetical protein
MLALVLSVGVGLVLAQDPADELPPAGDPAPAPASDPAGAPAPATGGAGVDPAVSAMKRQADELARAAAKLKELPPTEREKAADELRKKSAALLGNPVVPPKDFNLDEFYTLSDAEQALVVSRSFFDALVTGDAGRVVDFAGLPFMLEDRKIDRSDELRSTWARHLRSKRTDLITLYGIEVFTPAEMEKKYGPPPARLKSWTWRGGGPTYLAVANLSGRAAIVQLKPVGSTWQIVAYHD